jgi:ATPase subunit of ABC transporter with duplicated ATPase domains
MFISLSGVSFAHSDARPLFVELSIRFEPGWTGLVGPNGVGKTTLLDLLAGRLRPDAGRIACKPGDLRVHLCAQVVEHREPGVEALARARDGLGSRLRGLLALDPPSLERWPQLSPGERKRWQVGAALHGEPHVLLLDEPTNHLDSEGREHFLSALRGFQGVGALVSHDRVLLDALTERTLRFAGGDVRTWRGGYSAARAAWEQEEAEERAAYRTHQAERKKVRKRLADSRRNLDEASARRRRAKRSAGIKDIDTRKRQSWTRRRSAEARYGRETQKLRNQLGRLDARTSGWELEKALGRELFVDWEPARAADVLTLRGDLGVGARVLARDLDLQVGRASRIQVAGPNGAGKSTLLRALLDGSGAPAERILHLPQELGELEERDLVRSLRATPHDQQGKVLAVVAALGVDPEGLLATERPSPGEARKLALALGLGRRAQVLVLDEPTNHLDLPSVERLEGALAAYPGALVVVSHDPTFAARLVDSVWILDGTGIEVVGVGEKRR